MIYKLDMLHGWITCYLSDDYHQVIVFQLKKKQGMPYCRIEIETSMVEMLVIVFIPPYPFRIPLKKALAAW